MAYVEPGSPSLGEATKKTWGDRVNDALNWVSQRVGTPQALPDSATPSVAGGGVFEEAFASAKTVTSLADGVKGDRVTILITTSNMTIDGALTKTGMTIPLIAGDLLEFTHNGTAFKQTGGTVGLGSIVFIAPTSLSSVWIGDTIIAMADVDISGLIRKGSLSAILHYSFARNDTGDISVFVQEKGATNYYKVAQSYGKSFLEGHCTDNMKLDNNAVFQARYSQNVTGVVAVKSVTLLGYHL